MGIIRQATVEDIQSIAKIHVDTWRATYKNIIPDTYLSNLSYEERQILWKKVLSKGQSVFVAEENNQIIGFANGGKAREQISAGELYAMYIQQEFQKKGIGAALFKQVANLLYSEGYRYMILWVLNLNPAMYFYKAKGGICIKEAKIDIGGKSLQETCYQYALPVSL